MGLELIFYKNGIRYHQDLQDGKSLHLNQFLDLESDLVLKESQGQLYYQLADDLGQLENGQELLGISFYYIANQLCHSYDPLDKAELLLSSGKGADIYLPNFSAQLVLKKEAREWRLHCLSGTYYFNNLLTDKEEILLQDGDEISFEGLTVHIFSDEIMVSSGVEVSDSLASLAHSRYDFYEDYPDYHRSPRIIYRSSEEKISINAPGNEPTKPRDELLKLIIPPIAMIAITVLISIFYPRGIYVIMTMAMSLITTVFSIQGYFKNRKQYKEDLAERIKAYKLYLADKSIELSQLAKAQKDGQLYHYPDLGRLEKMAQVFSHRIYEKTPLHFDFLYYRLGLGQVDISYQLTYSKTERSGIKDPLETEGYALYNQNRKISDMPIVANLSHGPVGYIGPRELVLEQLQLMVNQLAFFHSYHDIQFITIMPEEEKDQWEWMRWLPHASLQDMNVRGFVYNQRTRDQVLNSLNQILKLRKAQAESKEASESSLFAPHYVVLVTDEKLILDHVIMEFFTEDPTALGCSLIFVQDVMSSLSENIQTVINIKDRNTGQLVMEEGNLKEIDFALDHYPTDFDKESLSRRLAPLNHLQNLKSSIPDTVTFMEMYGAEDFEDLGVLARWQSNAPYKSLAVPLGLRGQDDLVYLNLHEKAHGPHGLIAGTTGSGKSEVIQSYILSLAVNFHPHDVAFLLIDYKGGGMANLFKDLPHLLGTITNLDGAQSMRALVSINAELKRRQRLFAQADVNHINQYQKKYKLGEVDEPMPHLFLISDEFAELKSNQPDFMKELVSTARIGRSLGIHLILATQKPTGVVDDQIWSNSRFKLALKVADRQDSNEMLHTPDAAEITQAGRAYLQVGNNEVYELFQSAWSGADYQPDKEDQGIEDHTIYAINSLGQYEILNEDLSGLDDVEDIRQVPTELDAIVDKLQQLTQAQGIKSLPQPWLPPLEKQIALTALRPESYRELWKSGSAHLEAIIGQIDVPSQQAKLLATHDFEADGNLALYSAPGMGKSTFLQTLLMDLARQNQPDQLHFYLFDFGTNGLLPLAKLPHTADYFTIDGTEKLSKFVGRMQEEVASRKKLFSKEGVSTLALYQQMTGHTLPQLVIAIDSYDGIKEGDYGDALEACFQSLLREGSSLGIYLVLTAGRVGAVKPALQAMIKSRIVLKMTDDSDARSLIGRHDHIMEDIPGRGLIRLEEPEVFQVAQASQGQETYHIIKELQEEAEKMSQSWTGNRPKAIPIVPETMTLEDFMAKESVKASLQAGDIPIGLDMVHVEPVTLKSDRFKHLAYISDNGESLENIGRHLLDVLVQVPTKKVMLIDTDNLYSDWSQKVRTYITRKEELPMFVQQLESIFKERQGSSSGDDWFIFIPNTQDFFASAGMTIDSWNDLFTEGYKVGLYFVLGGMYQFLGTSIDAFAKKVRLDSHLILLGMRLIDQSFLDKAYNSKEPHLNKDEVYLHDRRHYEKVKLTS